MAGESTKDVSLAEERTNIDSEDTVLIVNKVTKEVQQIPVEKFLEASTPPAPSTGGAPVYYDDFFGL